MAMAEDVLLTRQRWPAKATGEALQKFRRNALVGNSRDPLIGFPIAFFITKNSKLTTGN